MESRLAIVCSKADPASLNIKRALLERGAFRRVDEKLFGEDVHAIDDVLLLTVSSELLYLDELEEHVKTRGVIFASRHASESGAPAFLTHTPGNWTEEALYGGKPRKVCIAMPFHLREAVTALEKLKAENQLSEWRCGLEVTHHGPYLENTPAIFVELGSTIKEWSNVRAAEVVAQAILGLLEVREDKEDGVVAVGFGGPHYAPNFTKIVLKEGIAVSHIIPKYAFPKLSKREVMLAIERNTVPPLIALMDWKGLKTEDRRLVVEACSGAGLQVKRL
ncbi:MAG: D-aminoacyl-tRNA deacylase [Candidatus Nezhaarchaeota archaeon]|nr:D-aminoacyl-tRNA deacylase [Candidatus Nezhaarchaeota archaeon]